MSPACLVCRRAPARSGALCGGCADRLPRSDDLTPGDIRSNVAAAGAWLVDPWGRVHALAETTCLGRRGADVAVGHPTVSRRHAQIERDRGGWTIRDLGSRNGTLVNDSPPSRRAPLTHGDRLALGDVALYFALGEVPAAFLRPAETGSSTRSTMGATRAIEFLPDATLHLVEGTGGGGGVLLAPGDEVDLTLLQFALVDRLTRQLEADRGRPAALRGYVPSHELLAELPWDTAHPSGTHVKQLVRRARALLAAVGLTIDSHRGRGYRLAASPSPPRAGG